MKNEIQNTMLHLLKIGMTILYSIMKLFPIRRNKITMLSRQSDYINIDFQLLLEEIQKQNENMKVEVLCKKVPQKFIKKISYCLYMAKCLYHIATSKVCIIDGYSIPISALRHKKELKIVQIWHAMGAIKKFGYQVLDKKEGNNSEVARIMKMHKNYDLVTCTSEATKKIYAQAFQTNQENIKVLGMPRIDYLLGKDSLIDKQIEYILKVHPNLKEKKVILYVPTFRKEKKIPVDKLINAIDADKYNLIIKLHPLDNNSVDEKYLIKEAKSTEELLKIAEYVITDYSALAFEVAALDKKLFFYLYDETEYNNDRGLNINLKEKMPNATFQKIEDIINIIQEDNYDKKSLQEFKKKYVETIDIYNSQRIINTILKEYM